MSAYSDKEVEVCLVGDVFRSPDVFDDKYISQEEIEEEAGDFGDM